MQLACFQNRFETFPMVFGAFQMTSDAIGALKLLEAFCDVHVSRIASKPFRLYLVRFRRFGMPSAR